MTFREKIQKEHPECVKGETYGGVLGCPSVYGYENEEKGLCYVDYPLGTETCTKCWNRETTEENENYNYEETFECSYCPKLLIF